MTDVRLTATNPEDSSAVPVACNSRGELLIVEPTFEQLDNDVTFTGNVRFVHLLESGEEAFWEFSAANKALRYYRPDHDGLNHELQASGRAFHSRLHNEQVRRLDITTNTKALSVTADGVSDVWGVNWSGVVTAAGYVINLEPENPEHYTSVRSAETGEEMTEYRGPVMDVKQELDFLRTQLRQAMEKIKMVPEGGWEVWDGSD